MPRSKIHRRRTLGKRARVVLAVTSCALLVAGVAAAAVMPSKLRAPEAAAAPAGYSIWADDVVPDVPADPERGEVTVGVEFSSTVPGTVTGMQFYRSTQNRGPHTGQLWSPSGDLLGSVRFVDGVRSGWTTAAFDHPVSIDPAERYVVSYTAPDGRYAGDEYDLRPTRPVTTRDLTAWRGVYTYGDDAPQQSWHWSNYYVDPVFQPSDGSDPSETPSGTPTDDPTTTPTDDPTTTPTDEPTGPSGTPTDDPTTTPTDEPTSPSGTPTDDPTTTPTDEPTSPTETPTTTPTTDPTPSTGHPDASNTGVPAGTTLTPYTGPCTITANGTVIDGKTVGCSLTINAANVVIRNSVVNGTVANDEDSSGKGFTIQDSEVRVGDRAGTGIGAVGFKVLRVEVTGGNRSINCWRQCEVRDSYVHGQFTDETGAAHESGIRMGADSTIVHNTIGCDAPDVPPDAGCSAGLTGYGDFAVVERNLIQDNLFLASTGGTCAYGGSSKGKPYSSGVNNIRFISNVFERGRGGKCGYWAPIMDFDRSAPGNVWSGNTWDDGATVSP